MGTFNFVGPNQNKGDHKDFDVTTYYKWGNTPGTSDIGLGTIIGDPAGALVSYNANFDAQGHRSRIEEVIDKHFYEGAYKVTGNFSFHVAYSLSDSEANGQIVAGGNFGDSYVINQGTVLVLDYTGICTQGVDSVTGKSYVNFDFLPYIGSNLIKMY